MFQLDDFKIQFEFHDAHVEEFFMNKYKDSKPTRPLKLVDSKLDVTILMTDSEKSRYIDLQDKLEQSTDKDEKTEIINQMISMLSNIRSLI